MLITEKLLQFIWQFQYFNKQNIETAQGENIQIVSTGNFNTNQGADFLNASIKINNITLVGNIEIHTNASQWYQHKHQRDINYNNIILHVVWENDKPVFDNNKRQIATLELKDKVSKILLERYKDLMEENKDLPCKKFLPSLSSIGWMAWKERLATERLIEKSERVLDLFKQNNNNWEETFWQLLAYNFGLKLNAELFLEMAKCISINILSKHKNQINQLEALLLGQANLLNEQIDDSYVIMLQKEFSFLQKKYALKSISIQPLFLRMRPQNFPTIRLAQLAMLVHQSSHLFSKIKEANNVDEVVKMFDVQANDFWHYHFTLQEKQHKKDEKYLGKQMINTIIINAIIPMLFAYGLYMNEEKIKAKAIDFLQALKPEKNKITTAWVDNNIENKTAFDSQALIQLTNNYCLKKKCLQCAIGNKILNN